MGPPSRAPGTRSPVVPRVAARPDATPSRRPATIAAGVLLILGALVNLARTRPDLHAPSDPTDVGAYSGMGLQLLLGVALIQGSEGARKFILWCSGLAMVAATLFVALFARNPAFWIVSAIVMISSAAIFGLLFGESPSRARMWVGVSAIAMSWVVGLTTPLWIGRLENHEADPEIVHWAAPQRTFEDRGLGVAIRIPADWVMLKPENDLVPASESTVVVLADSRGDGFAALLVQPVPMGIASADEYLTAVLKSRQENNDSVVEDARTQAVVGGVPARRLETRWTRKGKPYRGSTLAWRDEDRFFMLVVWARDLRDHPAADTFKTAETMISFTPHIGATTSGGPDVRLDSVTTEVPHLSRGSVALLIKRNGGRGLTPPEAFREAHRCAMHGIEALNAVETRELGEITRVVYGSLNDSDRTRLGEYLERVRAGQPTKPADDAAMTALMRGAVSKLPAASLARMRELIEQAILVGSMTRG